MSVIEYHRLICASVARYKIEKPIRIQYWRYKAGNKNNGKPFGVMLHELKLAGQINKKEVARLKKKYSKLSKVLHAR